MLNVFYYSYLILNKVYSEDAFLKQAMLSVPVPIRDRSAVTKTCYGVLEKDIILSYYIGKLCNKSPKLAIRTILKIAVYSIKFLEKAPYAVTDTAVELCNKLGKKGVSGFVNAVLRKFMDLGEIPMPENEVARLSLEYDYPEFAVEMLIEDFGKQLATDIMRAKEEPTCVRFNKWADGEKILSEKGITYSKTPYANVFFADKFTRDPDYDKGVYTFQSVGSVAICDALEGGKELLDACAAPGGKSVLLSEKFASVTACELHEHRAALIREYADRMKVENIDISVRDSSVFYPDFENRFDAVLCDLPCSGFGVMKNNPDIKLKKSAETVRSLSETQKKIIDNCAGYVRPGGVLYYSVCTFFKCECDDNIEWFLSSHSGFTPRIISLKIPYYKTDYGVLISPDISFGAGFYMCALERKI